MISTDYTLRKLSLIFFLFCSLNSLFAQKNDLADSLKSEKIIGRFDPQTQLLLKKFANTVIYYNDSAFCQIFAKDFRDNCSTSEFYKDMPLEDAIWDNLVVPRMDSKNYFDKSTRTSMIKGKYTDIVKVFYIGVEIFGGNGFRLFIKMILKDGTIVGQRIFLHPSGPNGSLEIHGSYG